jgi:hypothetical protein
MQRSRKTSPARTTKRAAYDDVAEEALRSPEYSFGMSEDKIGKVSDNHVPLSLRTSAGRQYRDEVFRLLVKIRTECDTAAVRLGYASALDDGLAAVEYIAHKILDAVRGERQQQKTSIKREPQAKSTTVQLERLSNRTHRKIDALPGAIHYELRMPRLRHRRITSAPFRFQKSLLV